MYEIIHSIFKEIEKALDDGNHQTARALFSSYSSSICKLKTNLTSFLRRRTENFQDICINFSKIFVFSSFLASSSPVLTYWQPTSPSHPSPGFTARSSSKCFNVVCGFSPGRISEKRRQIVMRTPRNNLPMNASRPEATISKTYLRTKNTAIFVWKISTLSLLRLL